MTRYLLLLLAACHNDVVFTTHAFVAPEPCGQGPYDVHFRAEGKMGSEGVEVWACTPRKLAGHVEMIVDGFPMRDARFGDAADNARCVGGSAPVITSTASGSGTTSAATGAPGTRGAQPRLVAQAFDDKGALIPDDACKAYGLEGVYLMNDTMTPMRPGTDIDVRIWSDAPNDLAGVVFLVRHAISTKTRAEEEKEWAKLEAQPPSTTPAPRPEHGAPPAPLAEARPGAPSASARWVPGYWTWSGSAWGWVAGFWREDGVDMPAPRVEVPGAAPLAGAVWIGGAWQLRAGAWIWVTGRWRR